MGIPWQAVQRDGSWHDVHTTDPFSKIESPWVFVHSLGCGIATGWQVRQKESS